MRLRLCTHISGADIRRWRSLPLRRSAVSAQAWPSAKGLLFVNADSKTERVDITLRVRRALALALARWFSVTTLPLVTPDLHTIHLDSTGQRHITFERSSEQCK